MMRGGAARRRWTAPGGRLVGRSAAVALGVAALGAGAAAATQSPPAVPAASTAPCPLPVSGPGESYHPTVSSRDFGPNVTNPFFPLTPGRALVYAGVKDAKKALDIVLTTARTKVVDGVRTRVLEDRLYLNGVLDERTSDYYAQDRCGNVWYFGEDTATLDRHGRVLSTEGSFHAGVGGAQPGVFMQAHPQIGRRFRQEWLRGHAEDTFSVVRRSARVTVPLGAFRQALQTRETSALEPGVLDAKYYVRGIGEVFEGALRGPREVVRLVEVIS